MDTRTLLRERLRRSRDWSIAIDELEKELEASGTKPEQSERLFELAALVEDVIPERERALGLYQRAWKLHPDNLKALSRAREVYGEIGRFEMVAKLGEMELRSPHAPLNLGQIVGEAMLDSGQKDKAKPILERALERTPDSIRVQDALLALEYDPEFWTDVVDDVSDKADQFDDTMAIRMLVRAARILRLESPDDPRLEELAKRILAKDIDEPSANFIYETVLAGGNRWDELESHHRRRADRAPDHTAKVEALRTFGLEWVQRFKDRDRGAKFFDAAIKATASNGATMKSVVAAFTLLRQVQGERGEWTELLDIAEAVLERVDGFHGEDRLYVAIQGGQIAFDKLNDIVRARKFFAIAASIESQNPSVQDFVDAVGLDEAPIAAGSMPGMQAATNEPPSNDGDEGKPESTQKLTKGERKAQARAEAEAKAREEADAQEQAATAKADADG
nr:hypothetical protein [Deltaproteobacteria bacterium]